MNKAVVVVVVVVVVKMYSRKHYFETSLHVHMLSERQIILNLLQKQNLKMVNIITAGLTLKKCF